MADPNVAGSRRRIAVLAPMPSELAPVRKVLGLGASGDGRSGRLTGTVADAVVVAGTTGIGTTAAREATQRLLTEVEVDHVLVVGIAGGVGPSRVGDVVLPDVVVDGESGREHRPSHLDGEGRGRLVTSDEFVLDPERLAAMAEGGVLAVDMETAAIAGVCEEQDRPWSVIRVISDRATDHPDDAVLGLARPDGSPDLAAVVRFALRRPWRMPQLARLGRDARSAATTAAQTCLRHLDASTRAGA